MKIADCLPLMTKMYLSRTVDSVLKDEIPRGDEDRLREQIRQNAEELTDPGRVTGALKEQTLHRDQRILIEAILSQIVLASEMALGEEDLFEAVRTFELHVVEEGRREDAFNLSDAHALEIYREVLEVALEDDDISVDEYRLLERLRKKLGVSRNEHRLLQARLGKFPKPGNELHSSAEFKDALKRLQTSGILLFCNQAENGSIVVLPEESAPPVKAFLGFEMSPEAQALFHDALSNEQLHRALKGLGLPLSGTKAERSERLLKAGAKPSEVLAPLSSEELREICRGLPGVQVSGSKNDRTARILEYFDSLTSKDPEPSDDPRSLYYQYFEEFAGRDNQNLYQRKLIRHDRDMETGFEEGTRYLFEVKLGCKLEEMPGTDHADGCVAFPSGELLLWDNKGKESIYQFPKAHLDQFRRYIRESSRRVTVFVVVVPSYESSVRLQAMKLKHLSGTDTDVAVITAEDLKWVAESWTKFSSSGTFSLELFNTTGLLDRATLEERMGVLL